MVHESKSYEFCFTKCRHSMFHVVMKWLGQRPEYHGALHGFHFHHHVSPGLILFNYGKNHAVHGTCHDSA